MGQVTAFNVSLHAGDRPLKVIGGGLADGLPSGFGGIEGGCEGIGLSSCDAAVSPAGVGAGGLALSAVEVCPESVEVPGVGAFGGVLPATSAGVEVAEVAF